LLSTEFESPRWREAVVVGIQKDWVQTLVRASSIEVKKLHLSSCQVKDEVYALVEAKANQLRSGVVEEFVKLGADNKSLLPEGSGLLDSGEEGLVFATASEPNVESGKRLEKKSASQSSSSTGSSPDDVGKLDKIERKWLDGGTASEKDSSRSRGRSKKSKRFALISKKSKKGRTDAMDKSTKSILEN